MANLLYVTPNALRVRVFRQRRLLLLIGLPGLIGAFVLHPLLGFFGVVLLASLWNQWQRHLHGASGEDRALGHPDIHPGSLAELPDHYIVFNNLEVPTENGGKRELDQVVLGRNGLFVVEVKNLRGEITGSDSDRNWQQVKRSQAGHAYTTTVRNPVSQVRSAAGVLHGYLASCGIDIRVQGIVVFTHPDVVLKTKAERVPVVKLHDLASTILRHAATKPPRQFMEAVTALKALRPGVPLKPESGLRHVSVFMRDFVSSQERLAEPAPAERLPLPQSVHKHPSAPSSPPVAINSAIEASSGVVLPRTKTHAGLDVVEVTVVRRTTTAWRRRRTQT
jgi:hypothetical protein